jgi:hypothetical protein
MNAASFNTLYCTRLHGRKKEKLFKRERIIQKTKKFLRGNFEIRVNYKRKKVCFLEIVSLK